MENRADMLMLSGVVEVCSECGGERLFVPVQEGCDHDGCEFCCTTCDAAVFLFTVVDNTGTPHQHVA